MAEQRSNPNAAGNFNPRTPSTPTVPTNRTLTPSPRTPGNPLSAGSVAPGTPLPTFVDSATPVQTQETSHQPAASNPTPSASALHPLLSQLVEAGEDDRNASGTSGRRRDEQRAQLEDVLKNRGDVLSLVHYAEDLLSSLLDRIAETITQARSTAIPIDRNQQRRHAPYGLDEYLKILPQLFKRLRIIEDVLKELLKLQATTTPAEDDLKFRDEADGAPLLSFEEEMKPRVRREQWNEYVDLKNKLLRRDAYIKTIIDTERAFLQQVNCISHP